MKIDFKGPQGNIFYIMGVVTGYLRRTGQEHLIDKYMSEVTANMYDEALAVSKKYAPIEFTKHVVNKENPYEH